MHLPVTWDISYFGDVTTTARVYLQGNDSADLGLTTPPVPGQQGFTIFSFPSDFLKKRAADTLDVTFSLLFRDGQDDVRDIGPTIHVREEPAAAARGTAALLPIIILPAILGAMLLGTAVFCVWSYRRNKRVPTGRGIRAWLGGLGRRGGGGYGVRQSHSQRTSARMSGGMGTADPVKKETNVGVELTDRDSWSPTSPTSPGGGRNVFREEVARQERDGR